MEGCQIRLHELQALRISIGAASGASPTSNSLFLHSTVFFIQHCQCPILNRIDFLYAVVLRIFWDARSYMARKKFGIGTAFFVCCFFNITSLTWPSTVHFSPQGCCGSNVVPKMATRSCTIFLIGFSSPFGEGSSTFVTWFASKMYCATFWETKVTSFLSHAPCPRHNTKYIYTALLTYIPSVMVIFFLPSAHRS